MTNDFPSTTPNQTTNDADDVAAKANRAALVELLRMTDRRVVEQCKVLRSNKYGEILVAPPGVAYLPTAWRTAAARASDAEFIADRMQLKPGLLLHGPATYDEIKATTGFLNAMGLVVDWIGETNRRLYIQVVSDCVQRIAMKDKKTQGDVVVDCSRN